MDGLALLAEARAAGLTVATDGGRLVIDGPQAAGPVAERLIAHKPAVLAALAVAERGGVWWDDRVPGGTAPIRAIPPRGCVGPIACARLGPCERRAAGRPCRIPP